MTIRPLTAADLDGALAANDAVGWRERRVLFEFYGARADSALFVAADGATIAGTGGATLFPGTPPTGWVHGIVVRPEYQRGGLGARLTEASIAWLRGRGAGAVMLLATDAGRPVYERLGFVAGARYGAFVWTAADARAVAEDRAAPVPPVDLTIERVKPEHLDAVRVLDREATGEDRGGFITTLASAAWVATRNAAAVGFHVACPWGGGPTIARDPQAGLALLRLAPTVRRRASRGPGVPEPNAAALAYLASAGIAAERHVTRMWLGTPPRWRPEMIFGVFNFGVG